MVSLFLVWSFPLASAADLTVCAAPATCSRAVECAATPASCFATVQAAIDAAAANDTIWLSDETYLEEVDNLAIDGLSFIGEGIGQTVISGAVGNDGVAFYNVASSWQDLSFTTPYAANRHCFRADGGSASFTNVEFFDCLNNHGGAIDVLVGAVVDIDQCVFRDNTAIVGTDGGGHIHVHDGTVTITDSTFDNGQATGAATALGGAIRTMTGTVTIARSSFDGNGSEGFGGAIGQQGGSLSITDCTFDGNQAQDSGGAIFATATDLTVSRTSFVGNSAPNRGGQVLGASMLGMTLSDTTLRDGSGGYGAAVHLADTASFTIERSVICKNQAIGLGTARAGGLMAVNSAGTVRNNAWMGNTSDDAAGTLYATGTSSVISTNNTFVGGTSLGLGAAIEVDGTSVQSTNDLFSTNTGTGEVAHQTAATLSLLHPLFWANLAADTNGNSLGGTQTADPLLTWTPGSCDPLSLIPPPGSPAIDNGEPSLLDPDGSPSDIGAFGGSGGTLCIGDVADTDGDGLGDVCDPCPLVPYALDADSDGFYECLDCDDGVNTVYPGAPEIAGNGVDEDCDGFDLVLGTGTGTGTGSGSGTGTGTGTGTGATGTGTGATGTGTGATGTGTGATGTGTGATGTGTGGTRPWIPPQGVEDSGLEAGPVGCGCTTGRGPGGWWLLLLLLLWRRQSSPTTAASRHIS